jgi:alkylation response protein AidB-like acyl-CoA dehydrogenase
MSSPRDPAFSRKLGARGWLGMALPREYGGGERSLVERFVVVEEMLRWGAPLGYHWTADRQSGPTISRFGTTLQKERFLPAICRGELSFSIGMSEPEAGSDLSSAAHRGHADRRRVAAQRHQGLDQRGGHLRLAHRAGPHQPGGPPQSGLTQFLVERTSPGLTVRPIGFIDGTSDFCEVTFSDVMVPAELVLGAVGNGWAQNTAELAFERGGPDRCSRPTACSSTGCGPAARVDDPRPWNGSARSWPGTGCCARCRCRYPGWPTPAGPRSSRPRW